MKKYFNLQTLLGFSVIIVICLIFKTWIFSGISSAGDFEYYSVQRIKDIQTLGIWDAARGGLGASVLPSLWLESYTTSTIKLALFIGWESYIRFFWYFPFIFFSFISAVVLSKSIFKNNYFSAISGLLYAANTYSLMLVSGGQMGIALSYAVSPFAYYFFIKLISNLSLKNSIKFGLIFSIVSLLDIRIGYMLTVSIFVLFCILIKNFRTNIKSTLLFVILIPLAITLGIHSFWLFPALFSGKDALSQLGDIYTSASAVKFFSFAKFENAISLLHPNWPENIFGKVGFMKPEFLFLPILAFASLLFIGKGQKSMSNEQKAGSYVLFFALLGLLGAFLAKGANEPFGGIYLWMFDHIPGFIMFRDPTKWYTLVAISYSILIPFSAWNIYGFLKSKIKNQKSKIYNVQNIFLVVIVFCLLYLIRPALFGQLTGTFKTISIPNDYVKLEQFLSSQNNFSRTLWVPTQQRFGFYSNNHPAIPAREFFKSTNNSQIINQLRKDELLLQEAGVKYVIVPFDSQGEIFLKDRKYNEGLYLQMVKGVSEIPWLKPVDCSIVRLLNCSGNPFGKIALFEVPDPKDHFFIKSKIKNQKSKIEYKYISPVEYKVEVKNAKKGDIVVFSESYDKNWTATSVSGSKYKVSSINYNNRFNSFVLPVSGSYSLDVYYVLQKYVDLGEVVSGGTLILAVGFLIISYVKKDKVRI
ncbi:MAG: hypothetical protein M1405_01190 [Patescibacteria group bacterium]|nr:hypothetical protein [Patescibacteria group bacterium]